MNKETDRTLMHSALDTERKVQTSTERDRSRVYNIISRLLCAEYCLYQTGPLSLNHTLIEITQQSRNHSYKVMQLGLLSGLTMLEFNSQEGIKLNIIFVVIYLSNCVTTCIQLTNNKYIGSVLCMFFNKCSLVE